jgi:hypothetical protein
VKLNPGFRWKKDLQNEEDSLQQQIGLKFEKETNEILHLERNII